MGLYDAILRGVGNNVLTYAEREFLFHLAMRIENLNRLLEVEVLEVSPYVYGLDPRFVTLLERKFEASIHKLLVQCDAILETTDFEALASKYRKSMPTMSGVVHYPYIKFPPGYLEAKRTEKGLAFQKPWHRDHFMQTSNRQRPHYFKDPMFPWRTYWQVDNITSYIQAAFKVRIRYYLRNQGVYKKRTVFDAFSKLTRQAVVKMILCGVALMDDYRLRLLAGEFTCDTPHVVLNTELIEESLRRRNIWTTQKRFYG